MSLLQETPSLIQVIDSPILPLESERVGKLKGIVLGGILSGIIVLLVISIKLIYKKVIA